MNDISFLKALFLSIHGKDLAKNNGMATARTNNIIFLN